MNKKDLRLAKKRILKCLTEDFKHGKNKRTGKPLKRQKVNSAVFDKQKGYAVYNGTDLQMVMDAVTLGLYFALKDSNDGDWILVGDELPENINQVNVSYVDRGKDRVTSGYYSRRIKETWVLKNFGPIYEGSGIKVIAWQPLPEPLRGAGADETEALLKTNGKEKQPMDSKELAQILNNRQRGSEITRAESAEAKEAGLVVVYGYSDDTMVFKGAIFDSVGCYGGDLVIIDKKSREVWKPRRNRVGGLADDSDLGLIQSVWDTEGFSWVYRTSIPHETFVILDDDDQYCRGIVFSLADVGEAAK